MIVINLNIFLKFKLKKKDKQNSQHFPVQASPADLGLLSRPFSVICLQVFYYLGQVQGVGAGKLSCLSLWCVRLREVVFPHPRPQSLGGRTAPCALGKQREAAGVSGGSAGQGCGMEAEGRQGSAQRVAGVAVSRSRLREEPASGPELCPPHSGP